MSSTVERAGEVADGEIITTPFASATFCKTAVVTPEQSAPIMALTPSAVISRSAVAVAAAASTQVESPRTEIIFEPPIKAPLSLASFIANSAPLAISGVNDSIGPVNPNSTPIFTSAANAGVARKAAVTAKARVFFTISTPSSFQSK